MGKGLRGFAAIAVVGAVAFTAGRVSTGETDAPAASFVTARTPSGSGEDGSLTEVIATATESIVAIETVSYGGPFGGGASGSGSGVVIGEDGIVVTNAHVIEGASEVTVTTQDGERHDAIVVGSDGGHDVALLKVDAEDLTPVTLGRSKDLRLGDTVVAIGYPLGLGTTATQGIVSGLDRTIQVADGPFASNELQGLLQTDAAINPGNSGGALVDSEGRLVGINTAAASAASAENVGFAVAVDEVLPVIEELLESV